MMKKKKEEEKEKEEEEEEEERNETEAWVSYHSSLDQEQSHHVVAAVGLTIFG